MYSWPAGEQLPQPASMECASHTNEMLFCMRVVESILQYTCVSKLIMSYWHSSRKVRVCNTSRHRLFGAQWMMAYLQHTLQAVPSDHAFAQLSSSDNVIAFTTARYSQQPLVIRCAWQSVHKMCRRHPCTDFPISTSTPILFLDS